MDKYRESRDFNRQVKTKQISIDKKEKVEISKEK